MIPDVQIMVLTKKIPPSPFPCIVKLWTLLSYNEQWWLTITHNTEVAALKTIMKIHLKKDLMSKVLLLALLQITL